MPIQNILSQIEHLSVPAIQCQNGIQEYTDNDLGPVFGFGGTATIFEDANDPTYLIKIIHDEAETAQSHVILEVNTFNRYHGGELASLVSYNGKECLRMPRLPGSVLNELYAYDFPDKVEAFKSFDAMLDELACKNILHNDFHADNILYDKVSNTFYPIDMADYTESFNKLTDDEQKEWLSGLDFRTNNCRELIKNRRNEEQEARDLEIKKVRELRALRRQQAEEVKLASSTKG